MRFFPRTKPAHHVTLTVDVRNMPDLIFEVRKEMAKVLRDEAETEADPRIGRRLREIAARFEAGASTP